MGGGKLGCYESATLDGRTGPSIEQRVAALLHPLDHALFHLGQLGGDGGIGGAIDELKGIFSKVGELILGGSISDVFPASVGDHVLGVQADLIAVIGGEDVVAQSGGVVVEG